MRREVLLSEAAIRDLEEIFDHIARHDAPDRAIHVMDQLEKGVSSLADTPERIKAFCVACRRKNLVVLSAVAPRGGDMEISDWQWGCDSSGM